ncbi:MAG: glycosyltransferase [Xanthobacteraceae bacterium]
MVTSPTCLLSINNYFYPRGGADILFLEQNRMFENLGWQVVPFAMRHPENLPSPWSEYFPDEIEYGHSYSLAEKLVRAPRTIYSLQARRRIESLLERVNPRIAHVHNVYHHLSPSILSSLKTRGIPVVLTIHDPKLTCPARTLMVGSQPCERCRGGSFHHVVLNRCVKGSLLLSGVVMVESYVHRLLRLYESNVTRFVAPSRFILEKFLQWGWPRDRIMYIPNFVDIGRFQPEAPIGRRFVYFGRLSKEKGGSTLLRAAAKAKQPLTLVGSGPEESELKRLAASLDIDVHFAGLQHGDALAALVESARAVVVPSECFENAPLAVLEAYAAGRPVIGANIGGIPELVLEGRTGALFPAGDADALAATLGHFAGMLDSQLAEMGAAGRHWVEQEFSSTIYRNRMMALYESLGGAVS